MDVANVSAGFKEDTETMPLAMPGGVFHNASQAKAISAGSRKSGACESGEQAACSFPSLSDLVCCTSPYAGRDDDGEDPAILVHDEPNESTAECWVVLNHKAAL